jgi:hypothetical protein
MVYSLYIQAIKLESLEYRKENKMSEIEIGFYLNGLVAGIGITICIETLLYLLIEHLTCRN